MRHHRSGKKLGRDSAHRKALYANLAGSLIEHGRIKTTEAKAKAVAPEVEKLITLAKRGDLHARRQAQVVGASVPLSEMFGYATTLRSMSQGRAVYTMQFSHYEEVPKSKAEEIINRVQGK